MSRVLDLDTASFDSTIKQAKKIFVDFWAPWCAPCMRMNPVIEKISSKYDSILFAKVNVEKYSDIATRYHISSLPAYVVFRDSKPAQSKIGAVNERDLEKFISENAR